MADGKISIDAEGFRSLAGSLRTSKNGFFSAGTVPYQSDLPFMTAHARLLTDVKNMLNKYAALIEKDFKHCEDIISTFEKVDDSQQGI